MLSLRFPVPVENVLTPPFNPRNWLPQSSRTQTPTFHSLPPHVQTERRRRSHSTRTRRAATTSSDVGLKEEPREFNVDGHTPSPEVEPFPAGLLPELMPRHVAVIMDGNGRWAKQRGLPPGAGHEAGVRSLRELVRLSGNWGIRVLTIFAFSYDNWIRPSVSEL